MCSDIILTFTAAVCNDMSRVNFIIVKREISSRKSSILINVAGGCTVYYNIRSYIITINYKKKKMIPQSTGSPFNGAFFSILTVDERSIHIIYTVSYILSPTRLESATILSKCHVEGWRSTCIYIIQNISFVCSLERRKSLF